jgi:hypothetical protein
MNHYSMRFASRCAAVAAIGLLATAQAEMATPQFPDVAVKDPAPPTSQELTGPGLEDFILHHATTHFIDTSTTGNLSRWRGGLQSICPVTAGLTPQYNAFVTARLRAVAEFVGAPVQSDPKCKSNVQVLFTNKPQEKMEAIRNWAAGPAFRNRYAGGMADLIAYRSDHAIQGWYLTTSGGSSVLNTDIAMAGFSVLPIWPQITQKYLGNSPTGSNLGGSGSGSGIGVVILVIDSTKVDGYAIGPIADYLAMLTLSVAQSPDHCDALPSILDLMSSGCGARGMPTGITAGDVAFLKALYYKNTGLGPSLSRAAIDDNMARQFKIR